ncbi:MULTISPECIES: F0F1 ATP synthase subunit epsilon [Leucobacter]|uniref:ATP synthase F1 complex delta/epsilon subunit N-terminal domain-containing protein n=1 Tax=Leucobacter iarius TaxID=333963 RepID=A0ABN2LNC6_9MICO|nr:MULTISPECIES: F0F1 ATP synthase subunit epsilon [unclassified Leucobacter]PIJ16260.1 ATP synthase F1 subunit epsilon [Leucobacter sp. OLES1]KKI21622.1 ATP synthase F0F1 subunit epsilon [Leucobacter sp. Ag1]PII82854.1 ATP synthase F1 subunit epsilon [Leucobacter sp. OLCALW19]PII88038.1 ATP synthase F1 subunit epsilon [Leucobacter sp. OLTLW20]PII91896.1 ATP synthase F1 subunit epsilon [Leucobacter sp. OLAS13]
MATLNVSVVSAEREIWSGTASNVSAKTVEGEIGIYGGHEPLLALLAEGAVRVAGTDGEKITVNAEDGFLSVDHDTITIVAGRAELVA